MCRISSPKPQKILVTDDRVRLALAHAGEREGQKVGRWDVAIVVAAKAGKLNKAKLLARAKSSVVAARQEIQRRVSRVAGIATSNIPDRERDWDRAVFSGIVRFEPICSGHRSVAGGSGGLRFLCKAHFGGPPGIF